MAVCCGVVFFYFFYTIYHPYMDYSFENAKSNCIVKNIVAYDLDGHEAYASIEVGFKD